VAGTLDVAKPGDIIFMVSYGSGAGSDAFLWEVTEHIENVKAQRQEAGNTVRQQIEHKTYINYIHYLKHTHKI
jgi:hydroxymethylglutaryl-CoA synthase